MERKLRKRKTKESNPPNLPPQTGPGGHYIQLSPCSIRYPTKPAPITLPLPVPILFSNSISTKTDHPNFRLQLFPMKRCAPGSQAPLPDLKMKKIKQDSDEQESGFMNLDENLLYEVLKHVDARTLAMASCVSKQWHKTAKDERLWELICTRHWANIGCGTQQLRSVVLPLGGFRRLHSLYLWPLSKPHSASASSWAPPFPKIINSKPPARWGKDEVHLCLSLLSIQYYEKMNFTNRGR
ncbi:hypothetical protein V6N11_030224 [Hibiscus sabdariffa]|uniref:F-box domain-containing protein n=1 Tax=Hibiscus sabdariffa TaxID=183260 RepID=A0ABR2PK82_9ROSI